jgi:hypothetical protein
MGGIIALDFASRYAGRTAAAGILMVARFIRNAGA